MNSSTTEVALVPLGVVTVTSTVPGAPLGAVAVIEVGEVAVMVAAFEPKSTALTATKSVPVMLTVVPPAGSPAAGLTEVTAGASS